MLWSQLHSVPLPTWPAEFTWRAHKWSNACSHPRTRMLKLSTTPVPMGKVAYGCSALDARHEMDRYHSQVGVQRTLNGRHHACPVSRTRRFENPAYQWTCSETGPTRQPQRTCATLRETILLALKQVAMHTYQHPRIEILKGCHSRRAHLIKAADSIGAGVMHPSQQTVNDTWWHSQLVVACVVQNCS